MPNSALTRALSCLLVLTLGGCSLTRSNWVAPGEIVQQQEEAVVHDPYANQQVAPPVVGGRPRDFQKDLAEPERSQPFQAHLLQPPW